MSVSKKLCVGRQDCIDETTSNSGATDTTRRPEKINIAHGRVCAMVHCYTHYLQKDHKTFHIFPKSKELCREWVHLCRRADLDEVFRTKGSLHLNRNYKICSEHFPITAYNNQNNRSQGLKKLTIPSVNLPPSGSILKHDVKNPSWGSPKQRVRSPSPPPPNPPPAVTDHVLLHEPAAESPEIVLSRKVKKLQKLLRQTKDLSAKRQKTILKLRRINKELQCKLQQSGTCDLNFGRDSHVPANKFILSQLEKRRQHKKGVRYRNYDKNFAFALHYCSPTSYRFMRKIFHLPTTSTLRRWMQNLHVSPSFNVAVLDMLKMKAQRLSVADRVVSIAIDEMSLKEMVSYHAESDLFEGYEDFGPDFNRQCSEQKFANQALVIMVHGIKQKFKQVIGYFLSHDAMPGQVLRDIVLQSIQKVQTAGFIPKVIVSDQGSNNVSMRNILGVTEAHPFVDIAGERVYFMYDTPHLLKSIRNNFVKYDVRFDGHICKWSYLEDFYLVDCTLPLKYAPKLTKKHLSLPPFSSMRVYLAAQVLSHSVTTGILSFVALNQGGMSSAAANTSAFLLFFDSLFDVFNSHSIHNAKMMRRAITGDSQHWRFLEEAEKKLRSLQFKNPRMTNPPCVGGWLMNIASLRYLWGELHTKLQYKFLMTRRITQDCLENFFSIIRLKGGNNLTPDPCAFRHAFKHALANQILMPSQHANCEMDPEEFLLKKNEIECSAIKLISSDPDREGNHNVQMQEQPPRDLEANPISYVSGWATSQITHLECRKALAVGDSIEIRDIHISMKTYDDAKLLYPSQLAFDLGTTCTKVFNDNIERYLNVSYQFVKARMARDIDALPSASACDTCIRVYINKFLNVLCNHYIKGINDNISSKINKRNVKAKKVTHA